MKNAELSKEELEAVKTLMKHIGILGFELDADGEDFFQDSEDARSVVPMMIFELDRSIKFSQGCLDDPQAHAKALASSMQAVTELDLSLNLGEDQASKLMGDADRYVQKEAHMLEVQFRSTVGEHQAALTLLQQKKRDIISAAKTLGIEYVPYQTGPALHS